MQHISQVIPQSPEESEPSQNAEHNDKPLPGRPNVLTEEHIDTFWLKMIHMYGHKWTSSYGEADDGTWFSGLRDLTTEQIQHGMRECLKREDAWPPTLPEFRQLANPNTPAYHLPFPKMPKPIVNMEIAEREMSKMKKIVGITS